MISKSSLKSDIKTLLQEMRKVKTIQNNVTTYVRPSIKSIKSMSLEESGQELIVYDTVEGWFELRRIGKNGEKEFGFIRKEDVKYSFQYLLIIPVEFLLKKLAK